METIRVRVDALIAQGRGHLAVRLVADDGRPLPPFEAGAHVDLHLGPALVRPYSIASAPREHARYLLCVKREAMSRGGSRQVHDKLRVGDVLRISPPRNLFALRPASRHLLVAGGIGITPLLSMAEALDHAGEAFELHHFVGRRADAPFARRLARGFTHGRAVLHASEEGDSCRRSPPPGLAAPARDDRLYLCGPDGFMDHVATLAMQAGLAADRIHREAFAAPSAGHASNPEGRSFTVRLASSGRQWPVPSDRSIASVLVEAGVAVPLSCEQGFCGACLTPVLAGRVDHRDSVQPEADKSGPAQRIALCCSRSLDDCLVLDL